MNKPGSRVNNQLPRYAAKLVDDTISGGIYRSMQKEPSAAAKANRQFFPSVEVDGEVYRCGDSVYVFGANAPATFDEDDELCEVCCKDADQGTMLECDVCLRGFHLKCLKPPLKSVPEV